ncbi:MAG: hypothetical protein AB7N65_25335, partial [Vicinamibacterales bacterium]
MTSWLNRWVSHRLRALVQKELNQIKRDRRIMMSLILPPIMQLMLFGTVMNPEVTNVNLGIVDDSHSPESRDLVAALTESGSFTLAGVYPSAESLSDAFRGSLTFRIAPWPTDRRPEEALTANVARGVLVVPAHFGRE